MAKTHWAMSSYGGRVYPACGAVSNLTTQTPNHVDCYNCQYTHAFVNRVHLTTSEVPNPAFEVTDEVKAAMKAINKIATRYAERASLCSQYDQFVEAVNRQLPEGAKLAGRYTHFKVTIEKDGVVLENLWRADSETVARQYATGAIQNSGYLAGFEITGIEEVDA